MILRIHTLQSRSRYIDEKELDEEIEYEGYSCISTYINNFLIVRTNSKPAIEMLKEKFQIRNIELNPSLYLSLQLKIKSNDKTKIYNEKYIKESKTQIEKKLKLEIRKEKIPILLALYSKNDNSQLLNPNKIIEYQRITGILQQIELSLRADISLSASSVYCFQCEPREDHMKALAGVVGYLKKYLKRDIIIDYAPRVPKKTQNS